MLSPGVMTWYNVRHTTPYPRTVTLRATQFFELEFAELEFITRLVIAEAGLGKAGNG